MNACMGKFVLYLRVFAESQFRFDALIRFLDCFASLRPLSFAPNNLSTLHSLYAVPLHLLRHHVVFTSFSGSRLRLARVHAKSS